jgi:hypothetical protein
MTSSAGSCANASGGAGRPLVVLFGNFTRSIESPIDRFYSRKPEGTFRQAHDALRRLAVMSREDDANPELLRPCLKLLPPRVVEDLGRRARVVAPQLFPGEISDSPPFESPECFVARFIVWTESTTPDKLARALRSLSADGGSWVLGRRRSGGRRSAARFEPQVLGVVRGSPEPKPRGGRPSHVPHQWLVMNLAGDWLGGFGEPPAPGRSDATAFGGLVHCVFEWLYVPNSATQEAIDVAIEFSTEAATYALRRHWDAVARVKGRSSPSVVPSHLCVDCKWVLRQGEHLDGFFCRQLKLPCAVTREPGQACGTEGRLFEPPG